MSRTRDSRITTPLFLPLSFVLLLVVTFAMTCMTSPAAAQTQTASDVRLPLKATLVLTSEFCGTKFKKGSWATIKETFDVGAVACTELQPALETVFASVTRADAVPAPSAEPAAGQVILVPRFVDVAAGTAVTAFSNREMDVYLEWTAKDISGKSLWIETVQGSAKHHIGNVFTHSKNEKLIAKDSVRDAAEQSAIKMWSSPELKKLAP